MPHQPPLLPDSARATKGAGPLEGGPRTWNLLREDVSLPAAVVYRSRLDNNLDWMQQFADSQGVKLAPHGKTTMTPAFFQMQRDRGAWASTLASAPQVAAAAEAGIERVILANQLVGARNMALVSELLAEHTLELFVLADSIANVRQLSEFFAEQGQTLPLLIEIGVAGGRCGCRTASEARALAEVIVDSPGVALAGIETYEGVIGGPDAPAKVRAHLTFVRDLADAFVQERRFETDEVILTGAGSAWYDLVAEVFGRATSERIVPVIRPGCYLIHDKGIYREAQHKVRERLGDTCAVDGDLQSSLEVWAYVQSLPEPGLAILTIGKRDAAFDAGLPQPARHYRPGQSAPSEAPGEWEVFHIMDQHSAMRVPEDADLAVGDMIGLSTSHPCLTFDKWRALYVIDDQYTITQQVTTCF